MRAIAIIFILPLLLSLGCAHKRMTGTSEPDKNPNPTAATTPTGNKTEDPDSQIIPEPEDDRPELSKSSQIENLSIEQIIQIEEPNTQTLYDDSRYDFPITMNSRVEGWIDYFTGRGRRHMDRYLARSSRYIPLMAKILKQEGLPEDLVYLALIESGFNTRARSHASAVGPWQFIKGTGTRYGLRVDAWIDERRDPIRSTQAAASYLKDLYLMFESWYLAAAAYNAGEYKILRAIERLKTNNFWAIRKSRMIRRETKDYVPKLIAAAIIAKNAKKYGFDYIDYEPPMAYETVNIDFPIHLRELGKVIDVSEDELLDLNPELVRGMVPEESEEYILRVPTGKGLLVERAVATIEHKLRPSQMPQTHIVQRGESIGKIAYRYGMSKRHLAQANNLRTRDKLKSGMKLVIPEGSRNRRKSRSFKTQPKWAYNSGHHVHKVARGDSLWSIAEQYGVTVRELFQWNNLDRNRIMPGMKIKVRTRKGRLASVSDTKPTATTKSGDFLIHTVKSGDSLWSIAKHYNVSVREIKEWNGLGRSRIYPGKKLKIKSDESLDGSNGRLSARPGLLDA